MIAIELKRLPHGEGLPVPSRATEHAAGLDVVSAEDVTLAPGERHAVATGFAIAGSSQTADGSFASRKAREGSVHCAIMRR